MTTIDFVFFNAGGGHRAAALALQEVIALQRRPWRVRLVNLVDMVDPAARFRRSLGFQPEDLYNLRLARGWTAGLAWELKLLQGVIRLGHRWIVQRIARHWEGAPPDLIVSLIPNFNRALHDACRRAAPRAPFVTVMTDIADLPPRFWIEPSTAQHVVCGSERAVAQARQAGLPPDRIWLTTGMVLRPSFYRLPLIDRPAARRALGLDPSRTTGVVLFGGHGSAQMLDIARELDDVQLVLMCGHNQRLAIELRGLRRRANHAVIGFTADVPHYLRLADFFVGKPGPGSISEAVQCGLPVIVTRNAWTMPQERWNADWVRMHGAGLVLRGFGEIGPAVDTLCAHLPLFRQRVAAVHNEAVFEVPRLLARILETPHARQPDGETAVLSPE